MSAEAKTAEAKGATDVAKVAVEHLDVSVNDLERHELVVHGADARDEKERGVAPVHDLAICSPTEMVSRHEQLPERCGPLYSRKLHMRVLRARTSWVTSLTILFLALGAIVVNHFASRTLPCLETSKT